MQRGDTSGDPGSPVGRRVRTIGPRRVAGLHEVSVAGHIGVNRVGVGIQERGQLIIDRTAADDRPGSG